MKNKILPIFLSIALIVVSVPKVANADDSYTEIAKNAANASNTVLTNIDESKSKALQTNLNTYISYLDAGLDKTDIGINLLFMQDCETSSTEIKSFIDNTDAYIKSLESFKVHEEYKPLIENAETYLTNVHSFNDKYATKMESLLNTYKDKINTEENNWGSNINRKTDDFDNSKIMLIYDKNTSKLLFVDENSVPDTMKDNQYLILKDKCLTVDTYSKDNLKANIKTKITEAFNSDDLSSYIEASNYPIFTKDGWAKASVADKTAALTKVSEDAVEELIYRLSLVISHNEHDLMADIIAFTKDYCSNDSEALINALDSLFQTIALTHCFEGDTEKDFKALTYNYMIKFIQYSMFALDVSQKKSSDLEDKSILYSRAWLETAEMLYQLLDTSLTGNNDYCYSAKTRLMINPTMFKINYSNIYVTDSNDFPYTTKDILVENPADNPNSISEKTATLLDYIKLGNPSLSNTNFADYLMQYLKVDTHRLPADAEKPNVYVFDGNIKELDITDKDSDLYQGIGWKGHPWGDSFRPCDADFTKEIFVTNKKYTMNSILNTDSGEVVKDRLIGGFWGKTQSPVYAGEYDFDIYVPVMQDNNFVTIVSDCSYDWLYSYCWKCSLLNYHPGSIYNLVTINDMAKQALPHKLEITSQKAKAYNFLNNLNNTLDNPASVKKQGTNLGSGDVVLICVLGAIAIAAIVGVIVYVKKKKAKQVK